jgi:hypothetical protein
MLDEMFLTLEKSRKKIENYFSGISDAVQGRENNNCVTPTPTN